MANWISACGSGVGSIVCVVWFLLAVVALNSAHSGECAGFEGQLGHFHDPIFDDDLNGQKDLQSLRSALFLHGVKKAFFRMLGVCAAHKASLRF